MKKLLILLLVLSALLLCACGKAALFSVSTNEGNTVSVTAVKAAKNSYGLGYLSVGEGEQIVAEANLKGESALSIQIFDGVLGSEGFPDEPFALLNVTGTDAARLDAAPGEYTVVIVADKSADGSAVLRVEKAG